MLHDGRKAVVVDPGDASPVLSALKLHQLELAAILVTHHHADHVGGINDLRSILTGPVLGPLDPRIPQPCSPLKDQQSFELLGHRWQTCHVPGHTREHLAYYCEARTPWLFCGDTLFSAGCGRLFEGTAEQMWTSLSRLMEFPPDTQVCCAHEYTLSNLRFAAAVEPENPHIVAYTQTCSGLRSQGRPTLPSTLAQESKVNPFLRCAEPTVVQSAKQQGATGDSPSEVLAALRQWKNQFQ